MALFVDHSSLPTSILKSAGEESKEPNPFRVIGHIEDTPLRLAKAKTLFSVYDYDDNGFIEKADFEAVAEILPKLENFRQRVKLVRRLKSCISASGPSLRMLRTKTAMVA